MQVNKNLLSMLSLGVFSVAVAGFGIPAEGGLFGFFGHRSHHSDCGYVADCSPACSTQCDYDDDDDDDGGWCGHGFGSCGYTACAPAPVYTSCACPPPVNDCGCPVDCDDDDDDDCDDDD